MEEKMMTESMLKDMLINFEEPEIEDDGRISFYAMMFDNFYDWLYDGVDWEGLAEGEWFNTYLYYDTKTGEVELEVLYSNDDYEDAIVKFDKEASKTVILSIKDDVGELLKEING